MNHQDTSGGGRRRWPTGLRWSVAGAALSAMLIAGAACSGSIEVPALNPTPTGQYHTGQVVWHDLVTPDVEAAKKFYGGLFGWTFQTIESNGIEYAIAMIGPRPVAGFYRPEDKTYSAAEWLQFFSVDDVDAAVARVATAGGTMIAKPADVPQRGRLALVEDREGAAFGLIRSASGDPAAGIASPHNDFLWNELWTNDMVSTLGSSRARTATTCCSPMEASGVPAVSKFRRRTSSRPGSRRSASPTSRRRWPARSSSAARSPSSPAGTWSMARWRSSSIQMAHR
jgi:hypothetical protein